MQEQNDRLGALLKQWPEIEPRPTFDQDVLRRVRLARAVTTESATAGWWGRFVLRLTSTWGIAATVAAALFAGFLLANVTSGLDSSASGAADFPDALQTGTLSGNYVAMMGGDVR